MVVGNVPEAADLVVAGAGPGGYTAALAAARAGRRVLLVDPDGAAGVGGVCLRVGCIPSKALIEVAELAARAGEAKRFGLGLARRGFDMARFRTWKDGVVEGLTAGVRGRLERAGVRIVDGRLSLLDAGTAAIDRGEAHAAMFVRFRDLVLATGSSPSPLPDLPFDGERVLDSTGVLALEALPERLAVVGAGYVGVELGTALAKLGSRVTLVEMEPRVLPLMDEALSRAVARRLEALGVEVATGHRARAYDGEALTLEDGAGATRSVPADRVLVAIGRTPNTAGLGLETAGLAPRADGRLEVAADRRLAPHVAAIGDLTPGPALAHKASAEAEVAVDALCGRKAAFDPAAIPEVVFSDPEVASAGLTLAAAREAGVDAVEARLPLTASGRAATLDARTGFAQVVADPADGAVLGVHLAGPHASDLVAEAALAIEMGATLEDLALTIHPHPTLSEQIQDVARAALQGMKE